MVTEPTMHEVNQYIQELDREYFLDTYEQAVFDKPQEPRLLYDLALIALIGVVWWVLWFGIGRAI